MKRLFSCRNFVIGLSFFLFLINEKSYFAFGEKYSSFDECKKDCENDLKQNAELCLAGDYRKPTLACQMECSNFAKIRDKSFLEEFLKSSGDSNFDKKCKSRLYPEFDAIEAFAYNPIQKERYFKKSCLIEALRKINTINIPQRLTCSSNEGNGVKHYFNLRSSRQTDKVELCMTDDIVDYIMFAFNEVVDCLKSINEKISPRKHEVDAKLLYSLLINESKGGFFLRSSRGIGFTQLTSLAVLDMTPGYSGYQYIEEALKADASDSCQKLKGTLDYKVKLNNGTVNEYCQFVSLGEGLARNLFYGFSYFLHRRNHYISRTISSFLSKYKSPQKEMLSKILNEKQIIDILTLISYGRDGVSGLGVLLKQVVRSKGNDLPTMKKEDIIELFIHNGASDYLKETFKSMCGLFMDINKKYKYDKCQGTSPFVAYSYKELMGETCFVR